ncbi:MAG: hypothetical protein R3F11_13835 [Verrucomicrobiales bacterium]
MTLKDRTIEAIRDLPEDADIQQVMREIAFIAGIDQASRELDQGQGMTADEAKDYLRACLTR